MNKSAARWSLAALVIVVALIVAIWPRSPAPTVSAPPQSSGIGRFSQAPADRREADTPAALAPLRVQANLSPCPQSGASPGAGPLAGISLECVGDGSTVDLGSALAGRPALLNLWAYWCGPCAQELPFMADYAARAGGALQVLTVHEDPNESFALAKLADYGVRLPGVQDGAARIATAVGAPSVLPISVLIEANGTVAKVLPQPFTSVQQIADAVRVNLGLNT